jgi:hypothetical protein
MRTAGISPVSLFFSLAQGALLSAAASHFITQGARTGELELLRTTPVGFSLIASAQWEALKRLLRAPVTIMVLWYLLVSGLNALAGRHPVQWQFVISCFIGAINLTLSVAAVCLYSLRFAFDYPRWQVIIRTVLLVKLLPWALSMFLTTLFAAIFTRLSPVSYSLFPILWLFPQVLLLAFYIWLIRRARASLQRRLPGTRPLYLSLRQEGGVQAHPIAYVGTPLVE